MRGLLRSCLARGAVRCGGAGRDVVLRPFARFMVIAMDDKDPTPEEIAEFKIISAKRMAEAAENRKYDRGAFYEREIGFLMREVRESLDQQLFDEAVDASLRLRSLATEAYGETRSPVLASALNDAGLAHKGSCFGV
jgi:hypothetical protein